MLNRGFSVAFLVVASLSCGIVRGEEPARPIELREAVQRGLVEIKVAGQSMWEVRLSLRASVDLTIQIAAGTLFSAERQDVQGMIVTQPSTTRLRAGVWTEVVIHTACANQERHAPGSKDVFVLGRAPPELEQLVQCLAEQRVPEVELQSAIWASRQKGAADANLRPIEADNARRLIVQMCVAERGEAKRASCESMTTAVAQVLSKHLQKRGIALVDRCQRKL
jgi:hypothetical protein